MTLETMKELFGVAHVRDVEEEVSNIKRMHIGEEEVSLSQPITVAVPMEGEDIPVSQGLRQLPLEEEDVLVRLECPPCRGPTRIKGMPCPYTALGKFFALLFSQKRRRFFSPFFLINTVDLSDENRIFANLYRF
jgi:hypothetical protein